MTRPHAPSKYLPLLLGVAIFMQMLDTTVLNTALPVMAADLREEPLNMQSAVIAYVLTLALLIPLSGYLADRFGTRKVFTAALGLFMAGSLLCAAADSLGALVAARVVQGLGGSMLAPVPRLTLMRVYEKSRLLNAINYAVMPALIAPVMGPLLGGYLAEYAGWHWIFLINLPIGMLGIVLALKIMPDIKGGAGRFDAAGFLLFAAAACLLTLAVETADRPGALPFSAAFFAAGVAALWRYRRHAVRSREPIYADHLFKVRTFRIGLGGNFASRLGISSAPFLLALMFQVAFGFGAGLSGWLVASMALASLLAKPLVRPVMARFGYRRVLVANTRILGFLIMALALPPAGAPLWLWVGLLFALGVCNSIQFSAMNTLTIADLRPYQTGSGNSLMAVNQQLAMGFGIALGALMLQGFGEMAGGGLHTAFRFTFAASGLITVLSGRIFAGLHRSDGQNLISAEKG